MNFIEDSKFVYLETPKKGGLEGLYLFDLTDNSQKQILVNDPM